MARRRGNGGRRGVPARVLRGGWTRQRQEVRPGLPDAGRQPGLTDLGSDDVDGSGRQAGLPGLSGGLPAPGAGGGSSCDGMSSPTSS
eukprot:6106631-Alexandrium_andersonii.AAC.1